MSSSSDELSLSETECKQECNRPISSSSSDASSSSSHPSEYVIEFDRNWSGYDSNSYVAVLGLKNRREVRRDTLSKLIKSDKPRHKRILNSIVTKAAKTDDDDSFVRLLAKNYKIQILNDKGQTALHLAFYHKSLRVISHISDYIHFWDVNYPDRKPDRTDYMDCNGLTHLHVACAYASSSVVTNYLENNNYVNARFCNSECPGRSGYTPLHFAVQMKSGYYDVKSTQDLIAHGANVNAMDDQGRTPLHLVSRLASQGRHNKDNQEMMKVMEVLVDDKCDINAQDNNGNTPLFMVFATIDPEYEISPRKINARIEEAELKLKFFLKLNIDLNLKNKNGNTLLHQVIESLQVLCYSYLKNPDFAFDDSKHCGMVKLILTSGKEIDINAKNNKGETLLQLAVSYLSVDIVQVLLEHKADVTNFKFRSDNDDFFKYTNVVLSFEPVQKLVDIVGLLCTEGFTLTLEDNLTILKFLTHSNKNCLCVDMNLLKLRKDIFHMMCLDLPEHVYKILCEFYRRMSERSFDYVGSDDYLTYSSGMNMLDYLRKYFFYLELGQIYVDQKAMNILKSILEDFETITDFECTLEFHISIEIEKEIKKLKSIFLVNDVCLHDVLMKNPEKTVKYFIKSNFDENCISNLKFSKDIVRGHATKSLIRYYVQKFAYEFVCVFIKMLSRNSLNDDCCLHVIYYLNVKDIFNVCLALKNSSM